MSGVILSGLHRDAELVAAARSSLYHRLAEAFAFPTAGLARAVASGQFRQKAAAELEALPFGVPVAEEALAGLAQADLSREQMEGEYIRLFEVGPGQPPCPLYEGSHRNGRMKIMEELVRFFEHFGLRSQPGDQPDHLCAELEFMHYLAFKEAAARSKDGRSQSFVLAQRDFLDRHLCRWLPLVRARLERLDPPAFYNSLVRLAEAVAGADLGWLRAVGENRTGE